MTHNENTNENPHSTSDNEGKEETGVVVSENDKNDIPPLFSYLIKGGGFMVRGGDVVGKSHHVLHNKKFIKVIAHSNQPLKEKGGV